MNLSLSTQFYVDERVGKTRFTRYFPRHEIHPLPRLSIWLEKA